MQTAIIKQDQNEITSKLIIYGDLSRLNPQQKIEYYQGYCQRLGLDPFCQPFAIIKFRDGKESLYCTRSGSQQLNRLFGVSHRITAREQVNGAYIVTAQASLPDGRQTESVGAVYTEGLKGDAFCNAIMKAETKAKRRSTLDLLGLGVLDESETASVPDARTIAIDPPAPPTSQIQPAEILRLLDDRFFTSNEIEQAKRFLEHATPEKISEFYDRVRSVLLDRQAVLDAEIDKAKAKANADDIPF